jgi:putative GTP pyrophosphokinase
MNSGTPSRSDLRNIDGLVQHYVDNQDQFSLIINQLKDSILSDKRLMALVHSVKWRIKDPEHLKDKLVRKLKDAKAAGRALSITRDNLFSKINDLAGLRILICTLVKWIASTKPSRTFCPKDSIE